MRLWSLHPKYLDSKGLVALWREGLLAKKVLEDRTKGYRNHPQLLRFKSCADPIVSINTYLHFVCDEADKRGYAFDRTKLTQRKPSLQKILVLSGQLDYEWTHLMTKLKTRDREKYEALKAIRRTRAHPSFKKIPGGIEAWEILK